MTKTRLPLTPLCDQLRAGALALSEQEVEPALVGARLMDGLRDRAVPLPAPEKWREESGALIAEEWARIEVLVRVLRESELGESIAACLREDAQRVIRAFPEFAARDAKLLTLDVMLKSTFRIEEFARKWVAALGAGIEGESDKDSDARSERLDFGGVLKNLKAADTDRASRQKTLKEIEAKRLKEEQEAYARAGRE